MKKIKILFLDKKERYQEYIQDSIYMDNLRTSLLKVEISVIFEEIIASGYKDTYTSPNKEFLKKVKELTETKEVQIVIIGNNMNVGYEKIQAVSNCLKQKTIITGNWEDISFGVDFLYQRMGFGVDSFCSRKDLAKRILQLVKQEIGYKEPCEVEENEVEV